MVKSFTLAAAVALLSAPLASSHYILNIRTLHPLSPGDLEVYTDSSSSHAQWQASRRRIHLRSKEFQYLHAFLHGDYQLVRPPSSGFISFNIRN